jgi:hypothetical protein
MRNLALILALLVVPADGAAPVPATPRPKKRAELEAEEKPASIPTNNSSANQAERYRVSFALLGTWEAAGQRLTIQSGGAYTLSGTETDAGFVRANLGAIHRRSARRRQWVEGTFLFRSIDAVEIRGVFGPTEWRRVR